MFLNLLFARSPRLQHKRVAGILRLAAISLTTAALVFGVVLAERRLGVSDWIFLFLALGVILSEVYWLAAPAALVWQAKRHRGLLNPEDGMFAPRGWFYRNRRFIRPGLHLVLIAASLVESVHVASRAAPASALLAICFFIYSLLLLEWVCANGIRHIGLGHLWWLWLGVSLLMGMTFAGAIYQIEANVLLVAFLGGFGTLVALVIYLNQRMDVAEDVWLLVVEELIVDVLKDPVAKHDLGKIVNMIASRLGYEHISMLQYSPSEQALLIVAEVGGWPSARGKSISVEHGITGQAYCKGTPIVWNDVRLCPYYESLVEKKDDGTRAEMAVPIIHQGQKFGVLDVQSRSWLVFGPADLRTLMVVAQILGAAWAAQLSNSLITQSASLWEQLSKGINSEKDVFQVFGQFARENLGAEPVIYYRLSPSGYPTHKPEILGTLWEPSRMGSMFSNMNSPLFALIRVWEPKFENNARNSLFYQQRPPNELGFVEREGVRSVCFIPIGTQDERMAVMFLNYRYPQHFDGLFQLMVLGFAQAFASVLSREWNRDLLFHGLGRPELGIHNILGRHGLKDGALQEAREALRRHGSELSDQSYPELLSLLRHVDDCLLEIRAQGAKVSLNWEQSLRERIDDLTRQAKDNVLGNHPVRFIKEIDPLVERESPWTRFALYRVVEEAVSNAIFHATATEISISMERKETSVVLEIQNNGTPLPEDVERLASRSGIFTILNELHTKFHAQATIEPVVGLGLVHSPRSVVRVQIPVLPISTVRQS